MPSDEIRRIAEKTRAHRVALAGDAVGPGAGTSDITCHQSEVNDGLGRAGALMRLIDAHCPPEGDAFAFVNHLGKAVDLIARDSRFLLPRDRQ